MSREQRLVTRAGWDARQPDGRTLFSPEFGATVHYSEVPAAADHRGCASQVRAIQAYHMDHQGWDDVAYSDLGCQHGVLYEGRGPLARTAANGTNAGNDAAHAVCALLAAGQTPTAALLDAIVDSLVFYNRQPTAGDDVNGHRDWKPTGCPGDPLYDHLPGIRARVAAALHPPTPAPAPTPSEDDMNRTCTPSWAKRQTDGPWKGRVPFLRVDRAPDLGANGVRVLAMNTTDGATAGLLSQDGTVYTIPFANWGPLGGAVLGIEEDGDGNVLLNCEDGGTIDVARRPS